MKFATLLICLLLSVVLCQPALAEGGARGGGNFRIKAAEYAAEAIKYEKKGKTELAALYERLMEVKLHAAELADQGHWKEIDWT